MVHCFRRNGAWRPRAWCTGPPCGGLLRDALALAHGLALDLDGIGAVSYTHLIFAWSGALQRRGELDSLPDLVRFGEALESASLKTLESGVMTKDLVGLVDDGFSAKAVDSETFLDAIASRLVQMDLS